MTLENLYFCSQIVAAIAIIASLIFVGLQVRQSTTTNRAAAAQAFSQQYSDLNHMLLHSDVREIFARGLDGVGALSPAERVGFFSVLSSISRTVEAFYYQKGKGALDSKLFEGWFLQYLDLHGNKGAREFWALRKHQYTNDFVLYLDQRLASGRPQPLYDALANGEAAQAER